MSLFDSIAIIALILAFGLTWFLFFRSLKVVKIIHKEKLTNLNQIKHRLKTGHRDFPPLEKEQ